MTLCTCPERPGCKWSGCGKGADWSIWQPRWGSRPEGPAFMCEAHFSIYKDGISKPIRGIDRPEYADDEWRGSILEMMRHARIAIAFDERNEQVKFLGAMGGLRRIGDEKFTPAQLEQLMVLRRNFASNTKAAE